MTQAEISKGKKIAIVGSGCSGMGALWALKETEHDVYLFEADGRLGGHTNTVPWKAGKYSVNVDTGFIVLNTATYPNFINFLNMLDIATEPSEMAIAVSRDHGLFEWAGMNLSSMFCQKSNLISPRMWRMVFDIVRFNQFALDLLIDGNEDDETIGSYLDRNGYSDAFRDRYLIPITAAVWSTSPNKCIYEFPALTLIRFLWNHHILSTIAARPGWLTLKEGSNSYIHAVMHDFPQDHVFLNSPVQHITTAPEPTIHLHNGQSHAFDHVILATHGDQALSILGPSATSNEKSILSNFTTSPNEVVLHSDLSHMPRRRTAWASWNYMTLSPQMPGYTDTVSLTYNMNELQHIPEEKFGPVLVTLNPLQPPDPALTQGRFQYSHPLYTRKAVQAQRRLDEIQNKRGISFAGAWTNYGFHEDGFSSGLKVARDHLGAKLPFEFVDATKNRGEKPTLGLVDFFVRFVIMLIQALVIVPLEMLAGKKNEKPVKAEKQM